MNTGLKFIFNRIVRSGSLTLIMADGREYTFGDGTGAPVVARFTDRKVQWELLFDPELKLG